MIPFAFFRECLSHDTHRRLAFVFYGRLGRCHCDSGSGGYGGIGGRQKITRPQEAYS